MPHTTRAIVLKTIRHGERNVVLKAYTELFGTRGYILRTGGKTGVKQAALQALSRLEIVADDHPERDLQAIRELRVSQPYERAHTDPVRGTLLLFVQEVLYRTLREEAPDGPLFVFLMRALAVIDQDDDLACFPQLFLLGLAHHLGFAPSPPEDDSEDHFDLMEGRFFRGTVTARHVMPPPLAPVLAQLMRAGIEETGHVNVPAAQRREMLGQLLLYYRLHLDGFGELRSPSVLQQVLG